MLGGKYWVFGKLVLVDCAMVVDHGWLCGSFGASLNILDGSIPWDQCLAEFLCKFGMVYRDVFES